MQKCNVTHYVPENICTGCGSCVSVCPVDALSMQKNATGCEIAVEQSEKCIYCEKCVSLCPQCEETQFREPQSCYALWQKSDEGREEYSSGGAASLLAYTFIDNMKGCVCGVTWGEQNKALHIVVDTLDELKKLCGSKYVQSSMENVWQEIQMRLENNNKVLFIGTPCQVDAVLRRFKSEHLYTIDLICHGTRPESYLTSYLKKIHHRHEIREIKFRGKDDFCFTVYDTHGKITYKKYQTNDLYFLAFLRGITYRENCYTCKYARKERVSDVTVGDFWGLQRETLKHNYDGRISLVIVNSQKGREMLSLLKSFAIIEERSLEEAIVGNKQLSSPMAITKEREEFLKYYKKFGFRGALRHMKIYKEVYKNRKRTWILKCKTTLKGNILGNLGPIPF